jgi:hypothetical protein
MSNDRLLGLLEDQHILLEARAASSAYVMRKAFRACEELQAFKGRADIAPALLEKVGELIKEPTDPVILGAHLYALELTGADSETRAAMLQVLRNEALQGDPMVSQFAGHIGFNLIRPEEKLTPGTYLDQSELQKVVRSLEQEEE